MKPAFFCLLCAWIPITGIAAPAHWSFIPPVRPTIPTIGPRQSSVSNPIDAFILDRLKKEKIAPAAEADRATLIRRVTFDLIGLPPTPEEIGEFVNDPSSAAYDRLIDRLLASPHYGERWGRHWLDLARFAETDGFEHDAARPHAWRYRDYVIDAFNGDKPYDRFVREQLAGDELWPGNPDALIATGFNLLGPDMVDSSDPIQRRHNTLNDMTDTTALAFLGLTVGCARCHDHKFEPLTQRDYFSFQAFFTPAAFKREEPIPTTAARAAHEEAMRKFHDHPTVRALAEIESPVRAVLRERKIAKLSPEAQSAHRTPVAQRNAEQANLALETEPMLVVTEKELAVALSGDESARRKDLIEAVKAVAKPEPLPRAMVLANDKRPAQTFVLNRGDYSQPREPVTLGIPAVLPTGPHSQFADAGPRTRLAEWIASPANPLAARVIVNRIWRHHFGRGLVETPSDFGTRGQKPTHPELLDWLASEFIAQGSSVKRLHKLMLTSATYLRTSGADRAPSSDSTVQPVEASRVQRHADPENRLYWRMNRLRLEGEAIRDSLLAISGKLNRQMGGPGVFPPIPTAVFQGASGWKVSPDRSDHSRRSTYIFARRNLRFPLLEVFDAPDSNLSCPARERSTTAPQSLALLNANEVTAAAADTADRLMNEARTTDERIVLATRLALGRLPTAAELDLARDFLQRSPLSEFCRALLNLNDFVYLD